MRCPDQNSLSAHRMDLWILNAQKRLGTQCSGVDHDIHATRETVGFVDTLQAASFKGYASFLEFSGEPEDVLGCVDRDGCECDSGSSVWKL
jgi:hypothetical protein